jgi:uncharacterized protein
MKIALILVAVLIGVWVFRNRRGNTRKSRPTDQHRGGPAHIEMVRCLHCDVHLAATEAVAGKRGSYCSAAHRHSAEP